MILSDIKHYLTQQGHATLADIALHCNATPDAVRGMLDQWISRGKVRKEMISSACGAGCSKCDPAVIELYIWNDAQKPVSERSVHCKS